MRLRKQTRRPITLLIALLAGSIASPSAAQTPAGGTAGDWVNKLAGLETAPDLDIAALRQQVTDRVKSRADGVAAKRPPVAPQLLKLPQLAVEIRFDEDGAVIRPESYQTLGRIADVISEVLANTFKISSQRLQAIGLGEEQLLDAGRPAAAANQRIEIETVGSALEPERPAPAKAAPAPRPTKPTKKPR